jgi:hypothetical protein
VEHADSGDPLPPVQPGGPAQRKRARASILLARALALLLWVGLVLSNSTTPLELASASALPVTRAWHTAVCELPRPAGSAVSSKPSSPNTS